MLTDNEKFSLEYITELYDDYDFVNITKKTWLSIYNLINRQEVENEQLKMDLEATRYNLGERMEELNSAEEEITRLKDEKKACIAGQETLQKYIAEQKAEIERLKLEMSYMKSPNTIGDRHEMGCW